MVATWRTVYDSRNSMNLGALFRYILVGAINTVLGFSVIAVLQGGLGLAPLAANAGGYIVGWFFGYILNRNFTFRSTRKHRTGLPAYFTAAICCYAVNVAVLSTILATMKWPAIVAQACAVTAYTVTFYLANRYIIFQHDRE